MTALLVWSLRGAGVVAAGLTLAFAFRGRSAALRSLVLRLTLAVAWLVPLAALVAPRVEVPLAPPAVALAPAAPSVQRTFQSPTPITEGWSVVQPDPKDPATLGVQRVTPFSTGIVPTPFLPLVWFGGAGFLLVRWLGGLRKLRRLRREARPTGDPDVWRAAIGVPATYGRTILVPLDSEEWPEVRLRAAVLHERAHVARRDWHWQTLATLFATLHWFNPLAWTLARALRDAAEAAADDAVLASGLAPSAYARELLAVAATVGPTGPALAMARRGGVRDRVAAILLKRDRSRPTRATAALLLTVVLGIGVVAAGVTRARNDGVRILDLVDGTGRHWDQTGRLVNVGIQGVPAPGMAVGKGERWVTMRLDLGNAFRDGGIEIKAASPARVMEYGLTDAQERTVRASLSAPKGLLQTDLQIGQAEGAWQEISGSATFRRTVVRVIGGDHPQYILSVDYPTRYRDEQIRIVARLRDGTEPKRIGSGTGHEAAFIRMHGGPQASIQLKGRPQDIGSVRLEHRPYRWKMLRGVRIQPILTPEPVVRGAQSLDRGSVSLLDVREVAPRPSLRWDARGATVPTPHDVAQRSYVPGMADRDPGQRLLEVRLAVEPSVGEDDLMVRPLDAGVFAPFSVSNAGGRTMVEATVYAPQSRTIASFRVGRGVGAWKRALVSPQEFAVRPTTRFEGAGGRTLEVAWPMSLGDVATRFEIRDASGALVPYGSTTSRKAGGKTLEGFRLRGNAVPARIDLWSRPYAWTLVSDVPLVRPPTKAVSASSSFVQAASLHSVELMGLTDGTKSWGPDGRHLTRSPVPDLRPSEEPFGRRLMLAFRVSGAQQGEALSARATAWSKYAYPSDRSVLQDAVKPGEKTAWCSLPIRSNVKVAKIGVDLFAGPLRTIADARVGDGPGKATVYKTGPSHSSDGRVWDRYEVAFNGLKTPGREGYSEIETFDERGRSRNTYVMALPFGPHRGYTVSLPSGVRPGRFVLRSCPIEHTRFDDVRLYPNP